jgi:cell division transport system ATP-binding protein
MRIKFTKVSKKFGPIVAVDDISFKVNSGDFVFITGPSGAGKTTIIRLICLSLLPSEGELSLGDLVVEERKKPRRKDVLKHRRRVGVIFQDFQLVPEYTVEENIAVALDILGTKGEKKKKKIEEVLEKVSLADRKRAFPAQLSGGELQRVCLARALAMNPKVLLADEPTGNLDPESSWQLMDLLTEINKEGTTVIMATHNSEIVDSLKKRVITLRQGRLVSDVKKGKYRG